MKKIFGILLLVILIFSFSGCSVIQSVLDSETISDEYLNTMLQSVIDGDENKAYDICVAGSTSKEVFHVAFLQIKNYWNDSKTYTYKKVSVNTTSSVGADIKTRVDCQYIVNAGDTEYTVSTIRVEMSNGESGLLSFNIVKSDELAALTTPTGTLSTLSKNNSSQWTLLILSLGVFLFTIFTFVHCLRHDIKLKWLWAIGILLLYISIGFTQIGTNSTMNFMVYSIGYSKLLLYPNGDLQLCIYIPIIAILYWCLKNKITKKAPLDDILYDDITPRPNIYTENLLKNIPEEKQSDTPSDISDEKSKDVSNDTSSDESNK